MLKELNKQLARFTNPVKAEMTPEEMETLKKIFEIQGSYEALYKWFLIEDEFTKGVSLAMNVENIPTVAQGYSKEDIADNLMYIQSMTKHIRAKLDSLKQEFVKELVGDIARVENINKEEYTIKEREKILANREKEIILKKDLLDKLQRDLDEDENKIEEIKRAFIEKLQDKEAEIILKQAEEKLKNAEKIQAQKQEEIGVGINA